MTAKAWLTDSKELKQQITEHSIAQSIPSAYGSLVIYESDLKSERKEDKKLDSRIDDVGDVALFGRVIALSTTAIVVGSINDTYANLPTITSGLIDLSHNPVCCDYVCVCLRCYCCSSSDACATCLKRCGPCGLCVSGTIAVVGSAMFFIGKGVVGFFSCVGSGCCEFVNCLGDLSNC